jgi:hypothetical protein
MLKSAQNFAAGFFGIPFEDMYQQSVTIEASDVRIFGLCAEKTQIKFFFCSSTTHSRRTWCTSLPSDNLFVYYLMVFVSCPNSRDSSKADRGRHYVSRWADTYLAGARDRLQKQITGYELSIEDTYIFQQLCAYEVGLFPFFFSTPFAQESLIRLLPWAFPSSVSCSLKRSGMALNIRE